MATSAFRSTTKRTTVGKSSTTPDDSFSSNRNSASRRSRSLSRFSRPYISSDADGLSDETPAPRLKFVNTLRGSAFPDISLDDLAVELFDSFSTDNNSRGRSSSRKPDVTPRGAGAATASQRRGRSVSRHGSKGSVGNSTGGGRVIPESSNSRRRRSTSVVRYQISDSESDLDHFQKSRNHSNLKNPGRDNRQMPSSHERLASNHKPGLRRSMSQLDLKYHDGYSSHSSALTDDEGKDTKFSKNGTVKTIRTVYAQKKADHPAVDDVNSELYDTMRKELRYAVEEIKMQLEQTMTNNNSVGRSDKFSKSQNSDVFEAISTTRRNQATKLQMSETSKQDLIAQILSEVKQGRDVSMITKGTPPDPNNSFAVEKPARTRRRSNDRNRMSKCLNEEAEKYIEDFILNLEETDISSIDGERSDTSSSLGRYRTERYQTPAVLKSVPVEMDGVKLPWLDWETPNEASPLSLNNKTEPTSTPRPKIWDDVAKTTLQDVSNHSGSSLGSWNPCDSMSIAKGFARKLKEESESYESKLLSNETSGLKFDVDDYLNLKSTESLLYETWNQRHRINSGGMLLCNHTLF